MSLASKRLTVYVRVVLIVLAVVAIGSVLWKNRANEVAFWFFWLTDATKPINVVWLMLCTAAGTLICWWAFLFGWGLWRDMREVKRKRAVEQAGEDLSKREAELNERDRRIDEKLKRAITEGEGPGN